MKIEYVTANGTVARGTTLADALQNQQDTQTPLSKGLIMTDEQGHLTGIGGNLRAFAKSQPLLKALTAISSKKAKRPVLLVHKATKKAKPLQKSMSQSQLRDWENLQSLLSAVRRYRS